MNWWTRHRVRRVCVGDAFWGLILFAAKWGRRGEISHPSGARLLSSPSPSPFSSLHLFLSLHSSSFFPVALFRYRPASSSIYGTRLLLHEKDCSKILSGLISSGFIIMGQNSDFFSPPPFFFEQYRPERIKGCRTNRGLVDVWLTGPWR